MTTAATDIAQRERLAGLMGSAPPRPRPRPVRKVVPADADVGIKLIEAKPTEEITGEFLAKVSDFEFDREGERFHRDAFDSAIAKVKRESRAVPLLYGHDQRSTSSIIGHVPPEGWDVKADGLYARGVIDTTNAVGLRIYKMLQKGALSWSVGFAVSRRRGKVLEKVSELYELSVVPVPANDRTRTLKLAGVEDTPPDEEDQRQRFADLSGEGTDAGGFFAIPTGPPSHTALHDRLVREGILARPLDQANAASYYEDADRNGDRHMAEGKSMAPIRVTTFDC